MNFSFRLPERSLRTISTTVKLQLWPRATNGYVAVVDERKATRIAAQRSPVIEILNSVDLIAAPELLSSWDFDRLAEALYLAARDARMRVHGNIENGLERDRPRPVYRMFQSAVCSPLRGSG